MKTKQHRDEGFTLVEVLLVIMVLGLLATIVVFSVRGTASDGADAACRADRRTLANATEAYFAEHRATSIPGTGIGTDRYEVTLAQSGLLRQVSHYHDVAADGTIQPSGPTCH